MRLVKFWEAPEIHALAQPWMYGGDPLEWSDGKGTPNTVRGAADGLAEWAGRACYWSYGKGRKTNAEYIRHIVESGHGSVLEHPTWTFGLKGVSRSLTHELVRHRHLSFSQLSQRFVTEEPEFVVPPALDGAALDAFKLQCQQAAECYQRLLEQLPDAKAGREAARAVLPNATASRVVVTGNARALRQMLALRGSLQADAEFRRLAVNWTKLMKQLGPNLFADFEIREEAGASYVYTPYPKV